MLKSNDQPKNISILSSAISRTLFSIANTVENMQSTKSNKMLKKKKKKNPSLRTATQEE